MESRIKLLGHPVHPMLIVFPLGLLSTAVTFDLGYVLSKKRDLAIAAFWALVAGMIGAVASAVFGLVDWLAIPSGTRAKRIGAVHGVGNGVVAMLFGLSLATRWSQREYLPSRLPLGFGLLGAALATVTAWLGGELVYRLRVGVDDDANLDAPNPLPESGIAELNRGEVSRAA